MRYPIPGTLSNVLFHEAEKDLVQDGLTPTQAALVIGIGAIGFAIAFPRFKAPAYSVAGVAACYLLRSPS